MPTPTDRERAEKVHRDILDPFVDLGDGGEIGLIAAALSAARAEERERAAMIAETDDVPLSHLCKWCSDGRYAAERIAAAIRALGGNSPE